MTARRKQFSMGSIAFLVATLAMIPTTRSERQWRMVLEQQLLNEKACTMALLSNIQEKDVDGEIVISAYARCEDGRTFDIKRERPHMKFSIKTCPSRC